MSDLNLKILALVVTRRIAVELKDRQQIAEAGVTTGLSLPLIQSWTPIRGEGKGRHFMAEVRWKQNKPEGELRFGVDFSSRTDGAGDGDFRRAAGERQLVRGRLVAHPRLEVVCNGMCDTKCDRKIADIGAFSIKVSHSSTEIRLTSWGTFIRHIAEERKFKRCATVRHERIFIDLPVHTASHTPWLNCATGPCPHSPDSACAGPGANTIGCSP